MAHLELELAPLSERYFWSLFRALSLMMTLGWESAQMATTQCNERTPWCRTESWLTLCCIYIGSVMYAVMISISSTIISAMNEGGRELSRKVRAYTCIPEHGRRAHALEDEHGANACRWEPV